LKEEPVFVSQQLALKEKQELLKMVFVAVMRQILLLRTPAKMIGAVNSMMKRWKLDSFSGT